MDNGQFEEVDGERYGGVIGDKFESGENKVRHAAASGGEEGFMNIDGAVEVLKKGGVVIFPTDTVWGIGVRADNPVAIKKFYRIKKREANKPTAILVADLAQAEKWGVFGEKERRVAKKYWPGALTLVVKGRQGDTVGLRVPDWPLVQELCRRVGGIMAGSANFAGEATPQRREDIDKQLISMVDMVVEGECGRQPASTVVDTTKELWEIIRPGPIKI